MFRSLLSEIIFKVKQYPVTIKFKIYNFDTGNHGKAVQQLLKQFVIIKENKTLVSLKLE